MKNNVIISKYGMPANEAKSLIKHAEKEVFIISPYISVSALKELEISQDIKVTIITTLKVNDILYGSSDIELYPYSKSNSITVFLNNNIHLKVIMRDWQSYIFGSSNLTKKGLGIENKYNYELNGIIDNIDTNTIMYFRKILSESCLMTDEIYTAIKNKVKNIPPIKKVDELDLKPFQKDHDYLISSLPMTKNIQTLYDLVSCGFESGSEEDVNCAIHDYILYDLPLNLSYEDFKDHLKNSFFKSFFISDLLSFIDSSDRYFGEIKEWIQNNCSDVPVPSRRDLTGNIQVLYKWIVELSNGQYAVDRPNYSERIYKVK